MRAALGIPLLIAVAGCAAAPRMARELELRDGDRILIAMGGTSVPSISIRNASSLPPEQAYRGDRDPNLKVVGDEQVQKLLDVLATAGFFRAATPAPAPQARATILVSHNDRRFVVSRRPVATEADVAATQQFLAYMDAVRFVWDSTNSYHTGRGTDYRQLYDQKQKVNRDTLDRFHKGNK